MKMRQALAPWPHHPRAALADHYLRVLGECETRSMTLLGPSGIGKTEFLTLDFLPLAIARGFRCVYADLAPRVASPVEWLATPPHHVACSSDAASPRETAQTITRLLLPSLLECVESKRPLMHIDSCSGASVSAIDTRLKDAIREAVGQADQPVMLVFDNVHVLDAVGRQAIGAELRGVPARSAAKLACVFAGSSREGLVSSRSEYADLCGVPGNRSGSPSSSRSGSRSGNPPRHDAGTHTGCGVFGGHKVLLPRLDDGFVQTVCRWSASRLGGAAPELAEARAAIRAVARSARLFRRAFAHVLSGDATQVLAAAESIRKSALDDARLSASVNKLSALQAVMLREVWLSGTELYASVRRDRYACVAGLPEVSKADVQGALKRLERRGLVYRPSDGPYALASTNLDFLFELDELQQSARRPLRRPAAFHVDPSPSWAEG
ncbi:ATP-binding protein [Pararobbsia alpina]|uniref:Orc1-like AAA ATPase domain-containing protein n=1 Tax=Pararobbsia alpina TaxID=621374 RepID=A0A6S7CXH5_9BURK|nr:ATP-binding protein [Pararobbsia alpina]CAB3800197.1 hypothetical protein LMG28138_04811 [Pararobbsia alpina]